MEGLVWAFDCLMCVEHEQLDFFMLIRSDALQRFQRRKSIATLSVS